MTATGVLVTGGSGLLGGELRKRLPGALYPSSSEFNVHDFDRMRARLDAHPVGVVIHAAAFTSPPKVDQDPERALLTNVIGTANVVRLCSARGMRLVYISTDYVFRGDRGNYAEEDEVHPVNKYAWSKLGGECAVRMYDNSLIIRTSFGPNVFPYPKAFSDQWTSRESVSKVAAWIVKLALGDVRGVLHVGGERKTVLQYAKSLDPAKDVQPLSLRDVPFKAPADTSLDCRKMKALMGDTR